MIAPHNLKDSKQLMAEILKHNNTLEVILGENFKVYLKMEIKHIMEAIGQLGKWQRENIKKAYGKWQMGKY